MDLAFLGSCARMTKARKEMLWSTEQGPVMGNLCIAEEIWVFVCLCVVGIKSGYCEC